MLKTPVVFIVFNRPDTTFRVFEVIRAVRPTQLFLIADGPRAHISGDKERCKAVIEIIDKVDWPCEVVKDYSRKNLGCRQRVISGLDKVFSQVPEAIILEDDCLPDPTFFCYCEEMLARYRNENKVMMISGNNYLFNNMTVQHSYYFSKFTHIWGWASWARAWKQYDSVMKGWPERLSSDWLMEVFPDKWLSKYWERVFEFTYKGIISSWALQLNYLCLVKNCLAIVPRVNLVTNIGFGDTATTTRSYHRLANVPCCPITFPLEHPEIIENLYKADLVVAENIYFKPILPLCLATCIERIKRTLSNG